MTGYQEQWVKERKKNEWEEGKWNEPKIRGIIRKRKTKIRIKKDTDEKEGIWKKKKKQ